MHESTTPTKKYLMIGLLSLLAGCAAEPQKSAEQPKGIDSYVQGTQALRAGDRDRAIALLEQAVAENPDLRMPRTMLGDAYRAKGEYAKAAVHYEAATRLDPYNPANHYNLGVTYQFLNRLQDAAAAYLRTLELNPKDPKANMNLGLVYLALGQIDDAVTYLERSTRLDPNSAAAWSNLGVAFDARGSGVLAESTYRKALELDSKNVVTLQNLAQNLISQGKSGEAISVMEQVVNHSDTPAIRKRFGDAFAVGKKYDAALAQYDLALKADAAFLPALNEKGFMMIRKYTEGMELDDTQRVKAIELWKSSLAMNPNQPRVAEALKKWQNPGLFGN